MGFINEAVLRLPGCDPSRMRGWTMPLRSSERPLEEGIKAF